MAEATEPTSPPEIPPEETPGPLARLTLVGALWAIFPILKAIAGELKEANRLRRVFYANYGIATVKLVDPREKPAPTANDDVEIEQPGNAYYGQLERRRQALRDRGVSVDDSDDLDILERLTDQR